MKKFICLLLVMVTCFSVTSYASAELKDIEDTKYEEAVEKLILFEIVNGYEDNTFKPANNVTRAELSKMLVVAMGKSSLVEAAKKKYLDFSDVLSSYWAYGHIKVASDAKLVNGYEDGTFKPAGNVTYAEAAAMILRALDYEDAVKNMELKWPDNYMSYADELELFEGLGTFKAGDAANRGDIAIMLWNALRTGTAEIVAYNDKGVIYGEGTPMITLYLGYTYLDDGKITNISFSDNLREATVTFKQEGKKEKKLKFNALDALEMFGRTISLLYDPMNGEILEITSDEDYKTVDAQITNVSDTKLYIANKKNGYKLPDDDNILLYGIKSMDEAAEAIMIMDGNSLEYLVLMGASDVEVGIVVDSNYLVDDEDYGIRVRDIDEAKGGDGYLVAGDTTPSKNSIILYYLDADDMLVVLKTIDTTKGKKVDSVSKTHIEVDDDKYEFEDDDEYTLVNIDGSKLESFKLSDVEKNKDHAIVYDYNMHYYIFIIEDAVYDNLDSDVEDALYDLEDWIEEAKEYDEADYTQVSYTDLNEAIVYAEGIDHTSKLSKINKAIDKLEEAIDALEEAGSSEKKTVAKKKSLRALVYGEGWEAYEAEGEYTTASYDAFEEVLEEALELLNMNDATKSEIEDMIDDLEDALDGLVKKK